MAQINPTHFKNPAKSGIFNYRIFLILTISFCAFSIKAQAKAKVTNYKRDFGKVQKGEMLDFKYWIVNVGNSPLLVEPYQSDCSCTKVFIPEKPILPNDSAIVNVKFDTGIVYERQDRTLKLNTNGGSIKLRFKGYVQKN